MKVDGTYSIMMDRIRFLSRFFLSLSLLLFSIGLTGCIAIPGQGGTKHYVIIGFGVVSVNESEKAVTATQAHSLGISISDRPGLKFGIGYASSTVVTVAPEAEDVRVEVSRRPGGLLIVDTQSAKLKQPRVEGVNHEQKTD